MSLLAQFKTDGTQIGGRQPVADEEGIAGNKIGVSEA